MVVDWHEEGMSRGERGIPSGELAPGESMQMNSFLGHCFAVVDAETEELLDYFVSDGAALVSLQPSNHMTECLPAPFDDESCMSMELKFTEFTHHHWHQKRLALNYVQPRVVQQVTADGYRKMPLPGDLHQRLLSWYRANEHRAEEETQVGPCMNQHIAPSLVLHLDQPHRDLMTDMIRPILEEWSNFDLKLTSIYGIRTYTNNSILRMHVDTVSTHAVSAIVNVAQDGMEEPWLLEILDHQGAPHNVSMMPGEMVLYESAKLLHGRPVPMKGKGYANVFIHFMPHQGWDYNWF